MLLVLRLTRSLTCFLLSDSEPAVPCELIFFLKISWDA